MQIFLGKPSGKIFNWMNTHQYDPVTPDPPTPPPPPPPEEPDPWADNYWANLVLALESGSDIADLTAYYDTTNTYGKMINNKSSFKYNNETGDTASISWRIVGRNLEIPGYVKYRRQIGEPGDSNYGFKRIYLKTTGNDNNLITFVKNNQYSVYLRDVDTETYTVVNNKTATAGEITITYGNENTYNVPASVVYDGKEYVFAGYNLTLDTNADLRFNSTTVLSFDNATTEYPNGKNCWAISTIRQQLQQNAAYRFISGEDDSLEFTKYVIPCVTRTWMYNDSNYIASASSTPFTGVSNIEDYYYTTTVDKYWLQTAPALGIEDTTHNDRFFITSKYNPGEINTPDRRKKYLIREDGTINTNPSGHMLRTADHSNNEKVLYIGYNGQMQSPVNSANNNSVSPTCIIG